MAFVAYWVGFCRGGLCRGGFCRGGGGGGGGGGLLSVPLLGHTKDHHKNSTNCLPVLHTGIMYCLKVRVVCGTVYGDMHFKDLLGSIARVR